MPARKHPKYLTCQYCGKTFTPRRVAYRSRNGSMTIKKFCSTECYEKSREMPVAICKTCGKEFRARAFHGRQRYCSKECTVGVQRAARVTLVCETCGKEFWVYKWRTIFQNPRYCSGVCANNIKRSDNERFSRLTSKSWATTRREVIARDGRKCRVCGAVEQLTVHHIVPWVKSRNDDKSNLITLCRSCHMSVEHGVIPCPSI